MRVKYINYGVGFRVGNTIYLNSALKQHPELHSAILRHEKNHTRGYSWSDIKMDIFNKELREVKREYYKFILTHPKALLNFLPVLKVGNHWAFDITLIIFYLVILISGGLIWSFI